MSHELTDKIRELAQSIADNCYDAKLILKNTKEILGIVDPPTLPLKRTPIVTKEQVDVLLMLYNINLRYLAKGLVSGVYAYEDRPVLGEYGWKRLTPTSYMFGCTVDTLDDLVPDEKTVVSIKELLDTAAVVL